MYEAREQEDILAELQEASATPASKIEGTFENDMLASNSIEFAKLEVELEQAYKAAFAETSWGDYLTMIAAERMEHYDPATIISEEEMLLRLGISEDDLANFDEVEIE